MYSPVVKGWRAVGAGPTAPGDNVIPATVGQLDNAADYRVKAAAERTVFSMFCGAVFCLTACGDGTIREGGPHDPVEIGPCGPDYR